MARVLLIDLKDARAQQVERKLRLWGLECSIVEGFLYALTMLEWQPPDLLLIRTQSTDGMTAGEFGATVRQDPKLRDIPLVFVAEPDIETTTTLDCFDLVLEPTETRALVMQVTRFLRECQRDVDAPPAAADGASVPSSIPRDLNRGELGELLEQVSLSLQSGRLTIRIDDHPGQVFVVFDHGRMVHAVFGGLDGPPAFRRMLQEFEGTEEHVGHFEPEPRWKLGTYPRTIQQAERQCLLDQASRPAAFDTQVMSRRLNT